MHEHTPDSLLRAILLCPILGFTSLSACSERSPADGSNENTAGATSARWPEVKDGGASEPDNPSNPWLSFDGSGGIPQGNESDVKGGKGGGQTAIGMGGAPAEPPDEEPPAPSSGGAKTEASAAGGATSADPPPSPPRLRFYEYYESTSSAKALGVENLGDEDALDCSVEVYSNGGIEPWRNLPIQQVPAFHGRAVLCTSSVERSDCTDPIGGSTFNGNDALILRCSGQIIDSFGRVGEDPGDAWHGRTTVELSSKDQRLLRCSDAPDTEPSDPFFLDEDWVRLREGEDEETALVQCTTSLEGMGGAPAAE